MSFILLSQLIDRIGMSELQQVHRVASSPADAIAQWYNAGGMISYYDYPLDIFLNVSHLLVCSTGLTTV